MNRNLCKTVLDEGGSIVPLIIDPKDSKGLGLMNPSIFIDGNRILLNIRNINYTLYHCEGSQLFNNRWGPLSYLHPENDMHLRTYNFMCDLNPTNLEIQNYALTDTSTLDKPPIWSFVGLEDARLVRWDGKLYQCGVRRDTTTNGVGRMELSEIVEKTPGKGDWKEISRTRIEPPGEPTYCEKNWMPVLDIPYHFVKWTNPTQVVKVNMITKQSETIFLGLSHIEGVRDFRGGSQIITWKDYHLCLLHEVNLTKNKLQQKDGNYMHRFIVWDKNWTIIRVSEHFSFMDGEIEFGCGLALYKGDFLCTFGFQDNAAFLLRIPEHMIENLLGFKKKEVTSTIINDSDKFKDFPPVYYVNFITSKDRRDILEKQFKDRGIKNITAIVSTTDSDSNNIIKGKFLNQLDKGHSNITASHLKAIKHWYNESDASYAIFFEDDVTLETSENWNFVWKQFIDNLPSDWDCVQLACIRDNLSQVKLHERLWDDWCASAYIIKRDYAKRLIDEFYKGDEFNLQIKNTNVIPLLENVLFLLGKTYTIPLFAENSIFTSSFKERNASDDHHVNVHANSSKFVIDWWKENGKNVNIDKLLRII